MMNIKTLTDNDINLISHALYKINKMAKIARDISRSVEMEDLKKSYDYESGRYYDPNYYTSVYNDETGEYDNVEIIWKTFDYDDPDCPEFPEFVDWVKEKYPDRYTEEELFCIEYDTDYFYYRKDKIINYLYDHNLLTNMGYHIFPNGRSYTCFGFGKHSFHTSGIWGEAEYAGYIDEMISSTIGESSPNCDDSSNEEFSKFFSWNVEDIPNWKEALEIIKTFIITYCDSEDEKYGCA